MSASVLTYKGRENIANAVNGTAATPKYIGWGTNAAGVDTYVAAKTDVALFTPATASGSNRATGTTSIVTVTTTNDGYQTVGTLTCTGSAIGVCEVGLFDSATYPTVGTVAAGGVVGSSSATTLNTSATFSPGNNNYIQIRTEVMLVTAGSGSTALTVTRAQNGSAAIATIAVSDTVSPGNPPGQTGISGGNMFAHADFAVINLNPADSIQFTVQYSTT